MIFWKRGVFTKRNLTGRESSNLEKKITPKNLRQNADYSPYEGRWVRGWPTTSIVRGQLVVHDNQLLVEKGWGQYVNRTQAVRNSTVIAL